MGPEAPAQSPAPLRNVSSRIPGTRGGGISFWRQAWKRSFAGTLRTTLSGEALVVPQAANGWGGREGPEGCGRLGGSLGPQFGGVEGRFHGRCVRPSPALSTGGGTAVFITRRGGAEPLISRGLLSGAGYPQPSPRLCTIGGKGGLFLVYIVVG